MEYIPNNLKNYNTLNLNFEMPKIKSNKFTTIEIDLIDACQLRCPMCLRQEDPNRKKTKLDTNDLINLMDFFKKIKKMPEFDLKLVRLIGVVSEPLLYPNIDSLIQTINGLGASVQISTNGNIKDPKVLFDLKRTLDYDPRNEILFAIEGSTQEVYEKYRVGGNLNKVLENFEFMSYDKKFKLGWQFIKFSHNINEYQKIERLLNEIDYDFIDIFNCNEPESYGPKQRVFPREDITNKFYKKRMAINEGIQNNTIKFTDKDIKCLSEFKGELFIDTNRRIWPCTNLYENNIDNNLTIHNIDTNIKQLNTFFENRCNYKECFKACSNFGHKLEHEFLRKRIFL